MVQKKNLGAICLMLSPLMYHFFIWLMQASLSSWIVVSASLIKDNPLVLRIYSITALNQTHSRVVNDNEFDMMRRSGNYNLFRRPPRYHHFPSGKEITGLRTCLVRVRYNQHQHNLQGKHHSEAHRSLHYSEMHMDRISPYSKYL